MLGDKLMNCSFHH